MSSELILRVRGPPPEGISGTLKISDWETLGTLKRKCMELVSLPIDRVDTVELLWGFPPTKKDLNDDDIIAGHITNQDNVRIQFVESAGKQAMSLKAYKAERKGKKTSSSSATQSKPLIFGANVNTLHNSSSTTRNYTTVRAKKKIQSVAKSSAQAEEDISEYLIAAANGDSGSRSKLLRNVFRKAVSNQYNERVIIARLESAYASSYTFEDSGCFLNVPENSGHSMKMNVTFPLGKSSSSRKTHTDTVDILSPQLIKEVLKFSVHETDGHGREILKPINMARQSPRIFWSIVKHFSSDIPSALRILFPEITDWSWINERKRQLSEKALENARQKAEESSKRKKQNINDTVSQTIEEGKSMESADEIAFALQDILDNEPLDGIVPQCYLSALQSILGVDDALHKGAILLASCDESLITPSRFQNLSSSRSISFSNVPMSTEQKSDEIDIPLIPSQEQIESWKIHAQNRISLAFWRYICGGSLLFFTKLKCPPCNIRNVNTLLLFKRAPEALIQSLRTSNSLQSIILQRPLPSIDGQNKHYHFEALEKEWIVWMCDMAMLMQKKYPWISEIDENAMEDEDDEIDTTTCDYDDEMNEEGWLCSPSDNEFIGKRVRIFTDDDGFWEDGTIVAYLPPTSEEPMALWKALIDDTSSPVTKKRRFQDLDELELKDAHELYSTALSSCKGRSENN